MNRKIASGRPARLGLLSTLRAIYAPKYLLFNAAAAVAYLLAFQYLVSYQNLGIALVFAPAYLVYLLIITASVLLTMSVRSLFLTRRIAAEQSAGGILGTASALFGGVVGGCGCSVPILFSLTAIGLSAAQVVWLTDFVSANTALLLSLMIVINLFAAIYYVRRISRTACKTR
jgi:hypothetical protein